jgi:hypothetical protein
LSTQQSSGNLAPATSASSDPAAGQSNVRGFNAQLLHLFIGRLFEMVLFSGDFGMQLLNMVPICSPSFIRNFLITLGSICTYLFLGEVGVPLSYIAIAVIVYRFTKLKQYTICDFQLENKKFMAYVVLPSVLAYTTDFLIRQRATGASTYIFALSTGLGVIYMTGFIVRLTPQLFITPQIKRVPYLPPRVMLSFAWDLACTDLLCYVIKVPSLFRVVCDLLIIVAIYQRWIYVHVGKQRLNEFGQLVGVDSETAAVYSGIRPPTVVRGDLNRASAQPANGQKPVKASNAQLTQPINKMARQVDESKSTRSFYLLIGVVILFVLVICIAPFVLRYLGTNRNSQQNFATNPPPDEHVKSAAANNKARRADTSQHKNEKRQATNIAAEELQRERAKQQHTFTSENSASSSPPPSPNAAADHLRQSSPSQKQNDKSKYSGKRDKSRT